MYWAVPEAIPELFFRYFAKKVDFLIFLNFHSKKSSDFFKKSKNAFFLWRNALIYKLSILLSFYFIHNQFIWPILRAYHFRVVRLCAFCNLSTQFKSAYLYYPKIACWTQFFLQKIFKIKCLPPKSRVSPRQI